MVVKYSTGENHDTLTNGITALSSPEHEATRRGGEGADHTFRGMLADVLQTHEREDEANLLRSGRPVFVHEGQVRAVPRSVEIRGRRWFQRTYGNTYHTAHAYIDGQHVLSVPRQYGYGDQYCDNAMGALERAGLIPPRERYPNGGHEATWQWRDRHGVNLDASVQDVPRQRDLNDPPPPSHYQPPPEPTALSRRKVVVEGVKRYSAGASDLARLLKEARRDSYNPALHGGIADELDDAHPGNKVAGLIRRQYGLGEHDGQGERDYNWYEPFTNAWTGGAVPHAAHIGTDGPFNLHLRHEGGEAQGENQRWVVHAVSRLPGSNDSGYAFEFPHEEAHLIPQMFPAAAAHINSMEIPPKSRVVRGSVDHGTNISGEEFRNAEASRFDDRMDAAE